MDLQQLLDEGIIDEVYQQLKTGKEAEVWLVSHRGEPVAAKLYKAREFRSFKNDAGYLEGRQVRNTRTQRAMDRGTAFGKQAAEEAWKSAEADALYALHAAGVRVPKPVLFYEGVLLMEVIGDHEGRVAPRLVDAGLTPEQARPLYELLRGEVIKMLAADFIHGDLSEFNILLGVNGPVIIDFPQTVAAARNSRSEPFFRRDLGNLVRFFSGLDPSLQKHQSDADEIWRAYVRRELTADFVPTGRTFHEPSRGPRPPGLGRDGGGRDGRQGGGPRDGRAGAFAGPREGRPGGRDGRPGGFAGGGGPRDGRGGPEGREGRPGGFADGGGPRDGRGGPGGREGRPGGFAGGGGPRDGRGGPGRDGRPGAFAGGGGPRDGRGGPGGREGRPGGGPGLREGRAGTFATSGDPRDGRASSGTSRDGRAGGFTPNGGGRRDARPGGERGPGGGPKKGPQISYRGTSSPPSSPTAGPSEEQRSPSSGTGAAPHHRSHRPRRR
jgi:RIO kinase 1